MRFLQRDHHTGRGEAIHVLNVRHDQHLCLRLAATQGVEVDSCVKGGNAYLYRLIACTVGMTLCLTRIQLQGNEMHGVHFSV